MIIHGIDLDGWLQITCEQSNDLRSNLRPVSSITDHDGRLSEPIVYTEWADDNGHPVLRDFLWPGDASRDCQHWIPAPRSGAEEDWWDQDRQVPR